MFKNIWNLGFKYKFFRLYIYHPMLFAFNFVRNPLGVIKLLLKVLLKKPYNLYGLKIFSPYKLNNSFFANLNTHYNCFIIGGYEENEIKLISKYLNSNDSVLELGGCLGVISCFINKKLNNPENHVVFEISPSNFDFLKKNKLINNCKFRSVEGLISNRKEVFFNKSNNFLSGKKDNYSGNKVDNIVNTNNLKIFEVPFNVLIMDIEGGEFEIINEIDLTHFNKIIYENHLSHELISKKEYDIIEKKLKLKGFIKEASSGNVDYWMK